MYLLSKSISGVYFGGGGGIFLTVTADVLHRTSGAHPGFPVGVGVGTDFRHGHFVVKTYAASSDKCHFCWSIKSRN